MSGTLQTLRNNALIIFFALLCAGLALSAALPQKVSAAAALTLTAASSTSNNASTTLAKTGNTVTFGVQLSGTPWTQGSSTINVFSLGSTTMSTPTNAQGGYWTYSTTSNATNWTEGAITYVISWGNTDGTATSTTSFTSNVVYDKTAPSGTASAGSYINRAASTTAPITFTTAEVGASYLYYLGTGLASTSGSGTVDSTQLATAADVHSLAEGTLTLAIAFTDPAGNKSATTTSTTVFDATAPADASADIGTGSYTTAQTVTLTSSGSSSFHYTLGVTAPADPTCSTGNTSSGSVSIDTSETLKVIACDAAGNPAANVAAYIYTIGSGGGSHHSSGGSGGGGSSNSSTPSTPSTGSSGLSSSQVGSILSLLTSFGADASVIAKVQASLNGTAVPSMPGTPTSFTRDLTVGSSGADVMALQKFLNSHGFMVAASGPGSAGMETTLFGGLTKAALAKFQAAKGISPAIGYFGPKTRAVVSSM